MATLTEVGDLSRKVIKYGIVVVIVVTLIPVTLRIGRGIINRLNPPPPEKPTVRYGKLPPPVFPATPDEVKPEYSLETIEGKLPNLQSISKVYVVGINKSRLLSLDRITEKAKRIGFTSEAVQLDEQHYRFVHPTKPSDMVVNIVSDGFSYKYDWTTVPEIYTNHGIPVGNAAAEQAKGFLQQLVALPEDLVNTENSRVTYLMASGSALVPTDSVYNANAVKVDIFRGEKDEMRVVTTGGDSSPVSVIISGARGDAQNISANYKYSQVLDDDSSTYPLKGVEVAWQELQEGKGYIAKWTVPRVIIRKVSVAYYESNEPQQFLQPVYLFEGDGGFMAYVWAIGSEYQQTEAPN